MAADWMEAVGDALDGLSGPHLQKKRNTILGLVDARLSGIPEERVFERPDTCSRTIWHTKWKHNPDIAGRLERIYQAALRWQNERGLRALMQAQERLALASPIAVEKLIERLATSEDENVTIRAAIAILDRAGVQTALKSSSEIDMRSVRELSDEELTAIVLGESESGKVA